METSMLRRLHRPRHPPPCPPLYMIIYGTCVRHPVKPSTLSTLSLNLPYLPSSTQSTQSIPSFNPSLSTLPLNLYYQPPLSTHLTQDLCQHRKQRQQHGQRRLGRHTVQCRDGGFTGHARRGDGVHVEQWDELVAGGVGSEDQQNHEFARRWLHTICTSYLHTLSTHPIDINLLTLSRSYPPILFLTLLPPSLFFPHSLSYPPPTLSLTLSSPLSFQANLGRSTM